jgi:hypothetical protein
MTSPKGVCVFDIDETITTECARDGNRPNCRTRNVDTALSMIDSCVKYNMTIALNTARKRPSLRGVDARLRQRIMELVAPENFCYRSPDDWPSEAKANCMERIRANVDSGLQPDSLILIDDKKENCERVQQSQFSAVQVDGGSGVGQREKTLLSAILRRIEARSQRAPNQCTRAAAREARGAKRAAKYQDYNEFQARVKAEHDKHALQRMTGVKPRLETVLRL